MMTILEAIDTRHSVRAYQDNPIDEETRKQLDAFLADCNQESGLNIFIRYDDPDGFDSKLAHYGSFRNVRNYIVLSGKKSDDFDYLCGYFGEKVVLFAQQLGLNTCWAALTFNNSDFPHRKWPLNLENSIRTKAQKYHQADFSLSAC